MSCTGAGSPLGLLIDQESRSPPSEFLLPSMKPVCVLSVVSPLGSGSRGLTGGGEG